MTGREQAILIHWLQVCRNVRLWLAAYAVLVRSHTCMNAEGHVYSLLLLLYKLKQSLSTD